MNNIEDEFYKSISDATICLSKIVVRHINASESCIGYIKHLKSIQQNGLASSELNAEIIVEDDCQMVATIASPLPVQLKSNADSKKLDEYLVPTFSNKTKMSFHGSQIPHTSSAPEIVTKQATLNESKNDNNINNNNNNTDNNISENSASNNIQRTYYRSYHQVPYLLVSNLPSDIFEHELKSLSRDIQNVLVITNKRNNDFS